MIINIDEKGCSYVDIDCANGYPINVAYDSYYKIKKYLSNRIKKMIEIGGEINSEEILYKIITEEGAISIFADWTGVEIRSEDIYSNILLTEIYKQVILLES